MYKYSGKIEKREDSSYWEVAGCPEEAWTVFYKELPDGTWESGFLVTPSSSFRFHGPDMENVKRQALDFLNEHGRPMV